MTHDMEKFHFEMDRSYQCNLEGDIFCVEIERDSPVCKPFSL